MTDLKINIEKRQHCGGGASRALRRDGKIPAVLYGEQQAPVALVVDPKDIVKGLYTKGFFTTVFDVDIEGEKCQALVKDIQLHPVKDTPIHVDLQRVTSDSLVKIRVPIVFENKQKSPGIKQGGTLAVVMRDLAIKCPVKKMPHQLTIDMSTADVNRRFTTDDLILEAGVNFQDIRQKGATIANLLPPKVKAAAS